MAESMNPIMPGQRAQEADLGRLTARSRPGSDKPVHTLGCTNSQCRVVEFLPHTGSIRPRVCPACYHEPG